MFRLPILLACLGAALAAPKALGQDPDSVADYMSETDRDASFDGRAEMYSELFPGGGEYEGSAAQNEQMLGVLRTGDHFAAQGEPAFGVFGADDAVNYSGEPNEPVFCTPYTDSDASTLARWGDDVVGATFGECGGASNRCDHLPDVCFGADQNGAFGRHDAALAKCNAPWYDFGNPCVDKANLALGGDKATKQPLRTIFNTMGGQTMELPAWSPFGPIVPKAEPLPQFGGDWQL
jgi:hypothetical protein